MLCGQKTQKTKQKQYWNEFNKDFKNSPHQKNLLKKREWGENNCQTAIQQSMC